MTATGRATYGKAYNVRRYGGTRGGGFACRDIEIDGVRLLWEGWSRFWADDLRRFSEGRIMPRGGDLFPVCPSCGYAGGGIIGDTIEGARIRPGRCECARTYQHEIGDGLEIASARA